MFVSQSIHFQSKICTHLNFHSFQHTYSFQEIAREDSPVEVAAPPPKTKSKPTRGCQNRTIENEDSPRQTVWTNAVENEVDMMVGVERYDMVMNGNGRGCAGRGFDFEKCPCRTDGDEVQLTIRIGRDKAKGAMKKKGSRSSG
ncbi:hypothetical protein Tco_1575978 [Tanacetum coccineum]